MRSHVHLLGLALVFGLVTFLLAAPEDAESVQPQGTSARSGLMVKTANTPVLPFTENTGQWDERVLFRTCSNGIVVWFCRDGIYYEITHTDANHSPAIAENDPDDLTSATGTGLLIKAEFGGASANPVVRGYDLLDYECNYFFGNDHAHWRSDVPNYGGVVYQDLYPGIDVRFSGDMGQLSSDWTIDPGADRDAIQLRFETSIPVTQMESGDVVVEAPWGPVTLPSLGRNGTTHRASTPTLPWAADAQQTSTSVILEYSTYFGGTNDDYTNGIAVDSAGNMFVVGVTASSTFPTANPYDPTYNTQGDVFVTKIAADGQTLIYSTFVGDSMNDQGFDLALTPDGSVFVTGTTTSDDFPMVNAFNGTFGGLRDAFVFKLSPEGNLLDYSTYLGGSGYEDGNGIAADADGYAYVTGYTYSTDFPTQNAYDATLDGTSNDAFVTKISPGGSTLEFSTFLGGGVADDDGEEIAIGVDGSIYVVGRTRSSDFPTANAFDASFNGDYDVFVTKFSSDGSTLEYSTFLGGISYDHGMSIAVDASGAMFVTGHTQSTNFPTQNAFQPSRGGYLAGVSNAFIAKLTPSGAALEYSTYLGGSTGELGYSIAIDDLGCAYVSGKSASVGFPRLYDYPYYGGAGDAFVTRLTPAGNPLSYSTKIGGDHREEPYAIAVLGRTAFITGYTASADYPTVNPYDATYDANEAFISKFTMPTHVAVTSLANDGTGTLRDLITWANLNTGTDTITFDVAGVISLTSPLPVVSDVGGGLLIDGLSAPGPVILDGSAAGAGPGLELSLGGAEGNVVQGLTIRNFDGPGILLQTPATTTTISQCLIHSNTGIPIDLNNDGVTPNDPGDLDAGPNTLLNYPTLDTIRLVAEDTFYVAGAAAPNATIELYLADLYLGVDTVQNGVSHGDAWQFLGATNADGSGHFAFNTVVVREWSWLTATATDASGNTSEMAANRQLIPDSLIVTAYSPVCLTVVTPSGQDSISRDPVTDAITNTIGSTATYDFMTDHGFSTDPDDQVVITNVMPGSYTIRVRTVTGGSGTYVLGIRVDGTEERYYTGNGLTSNMADTTIYHPVPASGESDNYALPLVSVMRGDFDQNNFLDALDLNCLIDFLFFNAPTPNPPEVADLNCDTFPDALDLNYLIDHLFFGGLVPCH